VAFFEFNIAVSGLFASQRGLSVTSNNITNATTQGYSRQVLNQKADQPLSGIGVGMMGTGVSTTGVIRMRDSYLDTKLWSQNDKLGEYRIKVEQNSIIETVYGEPSDTGFTKVFNDLFNGIDNLSKLPDEKERQVALRQQMINYTKYFNNISASLSGFQRDLNFELKSKVDEINLLGSRIQNLNSQIYQAEIYGDDANSFRDQRELCVDRLSQLINVQTKEEEVEIDGKKFKQFTVKIAGQNLVDHLQVREMGIEVRKDADKLNPQDVDGLYDVVWKDGLPFDMSDSNMSGEIKGVIDMRDGCGTEAEVKYNGIPYYIKRMDDYVRKFATAMNEEYSKDSDGYVALENAAGDLFFRKTDTSGKMIYYSEDAGGNKVALPSQPSEEEALTTYQPKYQLFTYTNGSSAGIPEKVPNLRDEYALMTAGNFSISWDIFDDAANIRTNYEHYPESNTNPNKNNNDLLLALSAQKDNKKMYKEGDPKDYMTSIFSELGINTQEANMYLKTQTSITNNIENQRLAVSQVDTNEEFSNLIKYQQAYQAAAKLINTIDDIYQTTIFRLGNF
jgi:flagellar hook-associated protein 1 FlgK